MDSTHAGADTPRSREASSGPGHDFLRAIVAEDLRRGKHDEIVTRFPPEPNGYLHIGHATAVVLNFEIAAENGGRCHLRFDDTNPETEDMVYVESAIEMIRWLGYDWGEHLYFASDYFERMYAFAEHLIREGKAYVDSLSEEEIREYRGTVTEAGRPSPYRDRSTEENLDLFHRMRDGEFPDGAHVLRARLDMSSPNMLMRDPILYRIRHAAHYRTGNRWCVYPMYDFAHPTEDAIESITHSFCTLEFENNRPVYDWVIDNLPRGGGAVGIPPESRPRQYEFARRNFEYTITSKRKLLQLVREGHVSGWDDPRMPTIAGLRRRGFTPESIRTFCETIGVARTANRVDIGKLEFAIRDDLNTKARRVLCVLNPLRVVITNYAESQTEQLEAPYYPHDVGKEGSRALPFSRVLYIDREDFHEDPPKGYFRLSPGGEVRLRYAYIIRCDEVVRNDAGEIVELRCSYDPATRGGKSPEGRAVRGTIQWVSAEHSLPCEVRLYDRLFTVPDPDEAEGDFTDYLNPESLVVVRDARVEPSVRDDPAGTRYQFERLGYFCSDIEDSGPDALVFNRTVTLRDTWGRAREEHERTSGRSAAEETARGRREKKHIAPTGAPRQPAGRPKPTAGQRRDPELDARRERYTRDHGIAADDAEILTRDPATATLFEEAVATGAGAKPVANWLIHELPRETQGASLADLPLTGEALGELVKLVDSGTISSSGGRDILARLVRDGGSPSALVDELGLRQVSDRGAIEPLVEEVLAAFPDKVEEYRGGKTGLLGFFIGQVMRRSGGSANPEVVREVVEGRVKA